MSHNAWWDKAVELEHADKLNETHSLAVVCCPFAFCLVLGSWNYQARR
jgi:hypothetical protein